MAIVHLRWNVQVLMRLKGKSNLYTRVFGWKMPLQKSQLRFLQKVKTHTSRYMFLG